MGGDAERASRFLRHLEPLQGALEAYCRRSIRDPNSVADVLQAAVGKAFRDFDGFVEGTNFRAWIFRYVHWEFVAHRRERGLAALDDVAELPEREMREETLSEQQFAALLELPEAMLEYCDEALAAAVLELAPVERAVLLLRALGEFSYRELAEILEIPMGTVMSHLARGRARLRERLADYCRKRIPGAENQP